MEGDAAARRPSAAMREWRSLPQPPTKAAPMPRPPPMHFDLTDRPGIETLQAYDLARLLAPALEELD